MLEEKNHCPEFAVALTSPGGSSRQKGAWGFRHQAGGSRMWGSGQHWEVGLAGSWVPAVGHQRWPSSVDPGAEQGGQSAQKQMQFRVQTLVVGKVGPLAPQIFLPALFELSATQGTQTLGRGCVAFWLL